MEKRNKLYNASKSEIMELNDEEIPKHTEPKAITESQDALENQLKLLQAEFENYKKRAAKEKEDFAIVANILFLKKLIPIIDEFEIVLTHTKKSNEETAHGIEMLFGNFMAALKNEGLKEMNALGENLDPYLHEAVRSKESDSGEGKIIEVVKKGYFFKDRVVRHAIVVISKNRSEELHKENKKCE